MKTFKEILIDLKTCDEAVEWSEDKTIKEVVETCHRGDWLLWLAKTVDVPLNKLTLAKARCAKTVIHLMKDQRSIDAVNTAERFGLDECTLDELTAANAAANAAYNAAANAAYAAAYAANAANAAANAAYAAYAAANAANAANAAYAAANAAYNAAYAADAKKKNQLQTADICRDILGNLLIELINEKLK